MAKTKLLKHAFAFISAVLLAALFVYAPDALAGFLPLPGEANGGQGLDVPVPTGDTGIEKFESILGPTSRALRIILGGIAILMIVMAGFSMVVSGDNEETVKTQKKGLVYAIVGLGMISVAGPFAEIFDYRAGNLAEDGNSIAERAQLFDGTIHIVVTFMKYTIGSIATFFIIAHGARLISAHGTEEYISSAKKGIYVSSLGLMMVFVSDLFVRKIFFDARYNTSTSETVVAINANELVAQLVGFTNLMLSFAGPMMLLGLMVGAVLFVVSGGNEERMELAKKIMLNSLIGIVIIYAAFALVSTVIVGTF